MSRSGFPNENTTSGSFTFINKAVSAARALDPKSWAQAAESVQFPSHLNQQPVTLSRDITLICFLRPRDWVVLTFHSGAKSQASNVG
jgi:hypothetical protein